MALHVPTRLTLYIDSEQLLSAKHTAEEQLGSHRAVLDDLDDLDQWKHFAGYHNLQAHTLPTHRYISMSTTSFLCKAYPPFILTKAEEVARF